jgi:hypothetical protein
MSTKKKSVFETLNAIDVNEHTDQKGNLTYLSWAWAWQTTKQNYPEAFYTVYENEMGYIYHHDNRTAWVKTGVTIEGLEHIENLPVLNYQNKSIPVDSLTSFDINTAIQRSLTKAIARHGLGLYLYMGETEPDTPVWDDSEQKDRYVNEITQHCADQEDDKAAKLYREMGKQKNKVRGTKQATQVWSSLDPATQRYLKNALSEKKTAEKVSA